MEVALIALVEEAAQQEIKERTNLRKSADIPIIFQESRNDEEDLIGEVQEANGHPATDTFNKS